MHYFKYREELNTNKTLRPSVCFGYEKEEGEKVYYDVLTYFDNFSSNAKDELNKIFNYAENFSANGIDKESWIRYLASYNITVLAMSKKITRRTPKPTKGKDVYVNYVENQQEKELAFYNKDLIFPTIPKTSKNLFENLIKTNNQGAIIDLLLFKEGMYKNDIELLYMVLDCLFSSNITYYIKKCELCQKYYIHHLPNKRYCSRMRFVYEYQTTCDEAIDTLYKSKQYKSAMRKDAKYLKHFHNDPLKYDIDKYNREKNIIKKECIKNLNITPFEEYIDNFYQSQK